MTKPKSTDGIEFIEVDGLKVRFQRKKVGGRIPVALTRPRPKSLYAYQRIWPIFGCRGVPYRVRHFWLWPIGRAAGI